MAAMRAKWTTATRAQMSDIHDVCVGVVLRDSFQGPAQRIHGFLRTPCMFWIDEMIERRRWRPHAVDEPTGIWGTNGNGAQ
jgi:hypothetical protein